MLARGNFPVTIDDNKGKNIHSMETIDESYNNPIKNKLEEEGTSTTNGLEPIAD